MPVERGRHEELEALNGVYAKMWRRQQEAKKQDGEFPESVLAT